MELHTGSVVQVPTSLKLDDFAPLCDEELATNQMGEKTIGDMRSAPLPRIKDTRFVASWSCGSERM